MTRREDEKETVGYGKPPEQHRFSKGQSGNPKGRPKGARNFDTDLGEMLSQRITITENSKIKRVTTQKAVLKRMLANALKGNQRAAETMVRLAVERSEKADAQSAERTLSSSEEEILKRFLEDNIRTQSGKDERDE